MWMPPRLAGSKPVHAAWILYSFVWYPDSLRLEVFIGEADDPAKRKTVIDFLLNNQDKYNLRMPKNPGPSYTTLRSYNIGSWKSSDPTEEAYVQKADKLIQASEQQFEMASEDLKRVVDTW